MKLFGVPWEDVREAGRLDRVYDAAIEERRRAATRRAGGDRRDLITRAGWWALLHVFDLVRWGSVLFLLLCAGIHFLPHPFREANGWAFHPWAVAFAFAGSLPMWRAANSWDLDEFLCLRTPSPQALLVARWLRMLPHLLLAGGTWAVYVVVRWSDTYDANPAALAMIGAAILPAPFMIVQTSVFGPVPKEGWVGTIGVEESASRWWAFGGLILLVICLRDISKPTVDSVEIAGVFERVIPGMAATYGIVAAVACFLGRSRNSPRERVRWSDLPASLLRMVVAGSWSLLLLVTLLWAWVTVPDTSVPWDALPGALLIVTALALPLGIVWRLRVAADFWTEATLGKGRSRPRVPSPSSTAGSKAPARYGGPRPSVMWAHVRYAVRGFSTVMTFVVLFGLFLLAKGLVASPGEGYGYLVFAGLCAPRWFEIEDRRRVWMFGMDLRDQESHDLRALALGGALPLLALSGAILASVETPEPGRIAFLGAVLLLRAGHRGLNTLAGLESLTLFLLGMLVLGFAAVYLPGIARAWPLAPLGLAGVLAVAGIVGLVRMRRAFTEERLVDEMRGA